MSTEIIRQIDIQLRNLLNIRALFPYTKDDMIGVARCFTAPWYQNRGLNITFEFDPPLTKQRIDEINEIGRWVNQSFVIRLCALLESYQVIPQPGKGYINSELEGHEEVDILRRLRGVFAHTSGRYNPRKSNERKLYERIVGKFSIEADSPETACEFPVPIDTLLLPLAEGCKRYVRALAQHENGG